MAINMSIERQLLRAVAFLGGFGWIVATGCGGDDSTTVPGDASEGDAALGDAEPPDAARDAEPGDADQADGNGTDASQADSGQIDADPGVCGDGKIRGSERCDDGNTVNGDGCSVSCAVELGWICTGEPSRCAHVRRP